MGKYRTYMHNQVRELLSNYGQVDMLWLDFSYPGKRGKGKEDWKSEDLIKMVRKLQPGIIVNDRLDLNEYADGGDFLTPEQFKVAQWPTVNGQRVPGKPARPSPVPGATTAMRTPGKTISNCSYSSSNP